MKLFVGVKSDGTIYKLLEYNLIEEAGKLDAPGRPTMYKTTINFLKMFGITNLEELPELPRYKIDENEQIVIDEVIEENQTENIKKLENVNNRTENENTETIANENENIENRNESNKGESSDNENNIQEN